MNRQFKTFTVQIVDKQYFISEKLFSEQTAIVSFFKEETTKIEEFAYINDSNFSSFVINKNIELSKCYINISEIKLALNNFIAENCIFFNEKEIQIQTRIREKSVFSKNIFSSPIIDFSNSSFYNFVDFSDCLFLAQDFYFQNIEFLNGMSFKNSIFSEGNKYFNNIKISDGEVVFTNVDFKNGNISFNESELGRGKKNFSVSSFGEGFVDFSKCNFGGGEIIFERTNFGDGNISFRSTKFGNSNIDFKRAVFGKGEKNFFGTEFGNSYVKFINAIFDDGKVNFKQADFGKGFLDIHFAQFANTDLIFDKTKFFDCSLDLKGIDIKNGRLSFNHLDFGNGDFILEGIEMDSGNISIKNSVFGKGIINVENANCANIDFFVENVDFGYGNVSFHNSVFNNIILKEVQINNYFDLRIKKCNTLDLSDAVVKDILDLNPSKGSLNVEKIYLNGIRLLGKIYFDWHKNNVQELIEKQDVSNFEKAEQYRLLKENYRNIGLYDDEDLAYVEFKRKQAKVKLESIKKQKGAKKTYRYINYIFEYIIFDKMGQYATNPFRVLVSMLFVYISISLIFYGLEIIFPETAVITSSLFPPDSPKVLSNLGKAFYHSAVTFLTIGYGDYYPVGIIRILSALEGFIGLFMMSYFTVAFVRKILR